MTRERRRAVRLGGTPDAPWLSLDVAREAEGIAVHIAGSNGDIGPARVLVSSWKPGDPVWTGLIDGQSVAVQVRPVTNGFDLAHRGVEVRAFVYTECEAAAARLMP